MIITIESLYDDYSDEEAIEGEEEEEKLPTPSEQIEDLPVGETYM